jgi:2-oxoglutarate dehydrogenase E1 component
MLLPHGFEGQGSEHSSARLERFLILCAQDNMQVCNPTTPAQYFHLLRRQIKLMMMKPLVIMTPKSLLRLPEAKSRKDEFINGWFKEVIDDNSITDRSLINNVIISSGKVYYDLIKYRAEHNITNAAIVRIEQLYPYVTGGLRKLLSSYLKAKRVIWVQEEPKNMGAWNYIAPKLVNDLAEGQRLSYSGRPESASPAVGSHKISSRQQTELVEGAFEL